MVLACTKRILFVFIYIRILYCLIVLLYIILFNCVINGEVAMSAILKSGACARDSNVIRTLSEVMSREMLARSSVRCAGIILPTSNGVQEYSFFIRTKIGHFSRTCGFW